MPYSLNKKPNSMCFIGKSLQAGRAYLTLKKHLPNAKLYQRSVNPLFLSALEPLTVNNWHCYLEFIGRVWGEFLRIKKYVLTMVGSFSKIESKIKVKNWSEAQSPRLTIAS